MWLKWFPLRWAISKLARTHGFLDPLTVLARVRRFAQPSEVREPLELLRAGVIFHARGLINSKAIQHNMDWVWPYWVEKQFDPLDASFVPRAFSLTHINMTQRNWTAVGLPFSEALVVVDPRGLVMPFLDSWSLDNWIIADNGGRLLPSRLPTVDQKLEFNNQLKIRTRARAPGMELETCVAVVEREGEPFCQLDVSAYSDTPAWAVVSARPYNPEGISFIHEISCEENGRSWRINKKQMMNFSEIPERHLISDYHNGDVYLRLPEGGIGEKMLCDVGMLTSASMFRIKKGETRVFRAEIPLHVRHPYIFSPWKVAKAGRKNGLVLADFDRAEEGKDWDLVLEGSCRLKVPDEHFQFLFEAAVRSLLLHSVGNVYPGPFTYRRFWFRDAAFILHGLLNAGFVERVAKILPIFFPYQTQEGFFKSQDGEWDSNGEALWIISRYHVLTGTAPPPEWKKDIYKAARWITGKRISTAKTVPYAGLLPAGFSAEHLGPNDYYYWDNFWGIAGLYAAANLAESYGDKERADEYGRQAEDFFHSVDLSLGKAAERINRAAMPASPLRRLDAGAIGSLAAGYPLQLMAPDDPRLLDTVEFILESCMVKGGFFQDMIHSGINPYLTIHLAQVLLRAGDPRHFDLISAVAEKASPTGQWPEAIHPATGGGCMGDGQHIWAAAEWVTVIRDCFVREELFEDLLVLGAGIPGAWLDRREEMYLGPTPTRFGPVSVRITPEPGGVGLQWTGKWRDKKPRIMVRLAGLGEIEAEPGEQSVYFANKTYHSHIGV